MGVTVVPKPLCPACSGMGGVWGETLAGKWGSPLPVLGQGTPWELHPGCSSGNPCDALADPVSLPWIRAPDRNDPEEQIGN